MRKASQFALDNGLISIPAVSNRLSSRRSALRAFSEALDSDRLGLILGKAPRNTNGALSEPGGVWSGGYGS